VLGSLFLTLTLSAVTLAVAAGVALLRVGRHAHIAATDRSARLVRLAVASTLVGLAALATAEVAGGGALAASVTALVLGGSVPAAAPAGRTWAVRGVVTWALLVVAAVGFLGWLGHRLLTSPLSATEVTVAGAAWSMAALAMVPLQRHARAWIGSRAARPVGALDEADPRDKGANRRPLLSLAVLVAAVGVAVAVATGDLGVTPSRPVEAGQSGSPDVDRGRASTGTSTGPASPSTAATERADDGRPSGASGADQERPGSDAGDEQGGDSGTTGPTSGGAGAGGSATPAPTSTATAQPTTSPEADPSESAKTPGYAKEKPNRPPGAPSPGGPKLP
jgi:hypothetical protein